MQLLYEQIVKEAFKSGRILRMVWKISMLTLIFMMYKHTICTELESSSALGIGIARLYARIEGSSKNHNR